MQHIQTFSKFRRTCGIWCLKYLQVPDISIYYRKPIHMENLILIFFTFYQKNSEDVFVRNISRSTCKYVYTIYRKSEKSKWRIMAISQYYSLSINILSELIFSTFPGGSISGAQIEELRWPLKSETKEVREFAYFFLLFLMNFKCLF